MTAGEVTKEELFYCRAEDDIHSALQTMAKRRVRRLPVVNREGKLMGVLSMDDIVLSAEKGDGKKVPELACEDVVETYKGIRAQRLPGLAGA